MLPRRLASLGTRRLSSLVGASPFSDPLLTVCREPTRSSARCGALGMKCGMTQAWEADGQVVPITVIELQDLQVTAVRTPQRDGITALQLGGGWQKRKRVSAALAGQFEIHGLPLKRYVRDFRVTEDALLPIGTSITARHFVVGQHVDVQGVTKGKGFQGVMKRWGFAGQPASHGVSLYHRGGGSLGGASGGKGRTRVWKGKKMAGRMGNKRRTMLNLRVFKVDPEHNLLYLKGTVAGAARCGPGPTPPYPTPPPPFPNSNLPPARPRPPRPRPSPNPHLWWAGGTGSIVKLRDAKVLQKGKRIDTPLPFPTFLLGDPIEGEEAPAGEASAAA